MLCRGALGRLAAHAPKHPSTDVTSLTRQFHRLAPYKTCGISVRVPSSRFFASAARPAGRPKKGGAVTAKASSKRATTRASSATKAKSTTKKAKPKKAAAKKKAAPQQKKRKVLTEEQKAKAAQRKLLADVKELKVTALLNKEPKQKPQSAWTVYNSENISKGSTSSTLGSSVKANAQAFRDLTPAQREHYNHLANQQKADNEQAYKSWVESHSAKEILTANAARKRLKQIGASNAAVRLPKSNRPLSPIKDERQVKRPQTSYILFYTERHKSGDFKQIKATDASKLAVSEWNALSQAEKKKYDDLHEEDFQRYLRQFKATYGYDAPVNGNGATAATVSA